MTTWISPRRLVRLARSLAGDAAGPGRPQNAELRRAVSTAYYAVFHRLAIDAARTALPEATTAERYALSRLVSHGAVKGVCEWVGGRAPNQYVMPVVRRLQGNGQVTEIARAFVDLQQRRYEADYDHMAVFTRADTLDLVSAAERVIDSAFRQRETPDFQAFHSLVLLRTSGNQRS